ncbi:hypothetical protein OB920_08395 [Halobacteria archaeon HArc-gm2]|nr:hypothetical protein [Halobacteria archaeon HArc-gm2]
MTDAGGPAELLDERPDLADPLEAVLAVDDHEDTWSFDDVPVDSGPFGELVSRGVVESAGDDYRVADPAAARAALNGDAGAVTTDAEDASGRAAPSFELPTTTIDRTSAAIVAAAIAFVGLVRAHPIQSVYRDGNVVLSGNDPYYYRYWVEQALAPGESILDLSALATLPNAVQKGEPLTVATLWWVSELLGGTPDVAGHVLAWYPVVSAVVTAAMVYLVAVWVTDDRRVGVAAVLMFALIPGHALRTSLGFADHHAFDFPWLAATALCLVALARTESQNLRAPRTWAVSAALGIAIAAQTLAWEAGPLLVLTVGLVVVAKALADVHASRSPLRQGVPIVVGILTGAALAALVHVVVGWHTQQVAFAPALLFVGAVGALLAAEAVQRTTGDVRHLAAVDAVGAVVGFLLFRAALPEYWTRLQSELDRLFRSDSIAETAGLLSPDSFGFLYLFGFALALALPFMAMGAWRAVDDDRWLVASVYGWYFFLLATFQVRFVGELAAFAAVFAGYGFVWVAAWIDAAGPIGDRVERLRLPNRTQLGTLVLLFVLVASLGIVQVPVKTSQVTITDDTYHTSQFLAEHSADLGQAYPDNYVLSEWGQNRHYNYFVSGESRSYGYAQSNYDRFIRSPNPDESYDRLEGRVGYVVLDPTRNIGVRTAHSRLTETYGSATDTRPGLAHYRALYVAPGESRVAYAVVPGATVTGNASANATVSLATDVSLPNAEFTYERQTTANADGTYSVPVAHPGTYRVVADGETREVTVSESAVRNGTTVSGSRAE